MRVEKIVQVLRGGIWTNITRWTMEYQNMLSLKKIGLDNWYIQGLNPVRHLCQLTLDAVKLIGMKACWWQDGAPVRLGNSDNDITTTPIVDIIGISTHGMQHIIRVPSPLKLQSFPFDHLAKDQLINIESKRH